MKAPEVHRATQKRRGLWVAAFVLFSLLVYVVIWTVRLLRPGIQGVGSCRLSESIPYLHQLLAMRT